MKPFMSCHSEFSPAHVGAAWDWRSALHQNAIKHALYHQCFQCLAVRDMPAPTSPPVQHKTGLPQTHCEGEGRPMRIFHQLMQLQDDGEISFQSKSVITP